MRGLVVVSAALFIVACGPHPNAVLPGTARPPTPGAGGTKPAQAGGAGGTTTTPPSSGGTTGTTSAAGGGSGGANPFAGSSGSSGGVTSSGGVKSSGGVTGSGGKTGGAGGTNGTDAAGVSANCTNAPTISGGSTPAFNTTNAVCFITCEGSTTYGWDCDSFTESDRSVTVNGTAVKCGATLPPSKAGYYYIETVSYTHLRAH